MTDTGYLRTRVQQNLHAHDDPNDPEHSEANVDDLGDMDITSLFSLINTVIVSDYNNEAPAAGSVSISKTVEGQTLSDDQYMRLFHFKLTIFDREGNELPDTEKFYFYGRDRTGYIASGEEIVLHHDEDLVVMGIPEGYTYRVSETDANQDGLFVSPTSGVIEGKVEKDAVHQAAFVNSQDKPSDPEDPNDPDNPNDPDGPGGPGASGEDGGGDGEGSLLERLGDNIPYIFVVICILAGTGALIAQRYARAQAARVGGRHAR